MLVQIFRCETSVWWYIVKRGWPRQNWFDFWRGCGTGRVRDEWAAAPRHHSGLIFSAVSTSALFCLWMDGWMDGCRLSLELSLSLMEFPHLETCACILKIPIDHLSDASKRPCKFITQAIFRIFELPHAWVFSHEPPFSHASVWKLESRQAGSGCDDCLACN